jgi:hypothetical protein
MDTSEQEFGLFLAMFVMALLVIAVLGFVVISQNRRIKTITTPRYGFLGKPLTFFALTLFSLSIGMTLYAVDLKREPDSDSVSVTDVQDDITLKILTTTINSNGNLYRFNAVPTINNLDWAINPGTTINIEWTIINKKGDITITENKSEVNLNINYKGGILVTLTNGENLIRAKSTVNGQEIIAETIILI